MDFPDGWRLRVRYEVPLREFIPRSTTGWALFALGVIVYLLLEGLHFRHKLGQPHYHDALAELRSDLPWIMLGVAAVQISMKYHSICDEFSNANATISQTVRDGKLDNNEGLFAASALRTLRIDEGGARPGRVTLVFSGAVVKRATFVGWPGVPRGVAESILRAVQERMGTAQQDRQPALEHPPAKALSVTVARTSCTSEAYPRLR